MYREGIAALFPEPIQWAQLKLFRLKQHNSVPLNPSASYLCAFFSLPIDGRRYTTRYSFRRYSYLPCGVGCVVLGGYNQKFWKWYSVRCKKLQFHHILHCEKFQRYWSISRGPHFMSNSDKKKWKIHFFYFFLTNNFFFNLHRVMCKNEVFYRIKRFEKFHFIWWTS